MLQVPDSEHEERVQRRAGSEFDSSNVQQMLHSAFARGFPRFAQISWILLVVVLLCFGGLHIVVALHWVVPSIWLNAAELGNLAVANLKLFADILTECFSCHQGKS